MSPQPQDDSLAEDREARSDFHFTVALHVEDNKQDPYRAVSPVVPPQSRATVPTGHTHCGTIGTLLPAHRSVIPAVVG